MTLFKDGKILGILLVTVVFGAVISFPYRASALTLTPIRLEISGNPGETLNHEITLINEKDVQETFFSSFANFTANGETGNPSFTNDNTGIATWIEAPNSVSLAPGLSEIVNISITIPKNAEPGGYFGTIFWGTAPDIASPGEVSIGSKTGILILLSVNGDVKEEGGLLDFDTKDGKHFFSSLPIVFSYRFQNNGGDRIKPEGTILVRNTLRIKDAEFSANKVEGNILPTQIRRFETTLVGSRKNASEEPKNISGFFKKAKYEWQNFALGWYTARIELVFGDSAQKVEDKVSFFVFPWRFLIIFLVVVYGALRILKILLRKYNQRIIRQASLHNSSKNK